MHLTAAGLFAGNRSYVASITYKKVLLDDDVFACEFEFHDLVYTEVSNVAT